MEDWAYAGSWENSFYTDINETVVFPIKKCKPLTFNGYEKKKTKYDDTSLRSLMYLVEAADQKRPDERELGNDDFLFDLSKFLNKSADNKFFGHIARNIRLIFASADLIYGYFNINKINFSGKETKFSYTVSLMGCEETGVVVTVLGVRLN